MALTKDGILDVTTLGIREVTLARGLGTVCVRGLSLREYDGFEMVVTEAKRGGLITLRAELLVRTLCDEKGARLFADGDVEALATLDQVALEPAFQAAAELAGLREDVGKNSPGGPGGGSSSGSPTASDAP
jgi:hypothetical protein